MTKISSEGQREMAQSQQHQLMELFDAAVDLTTDEQKEVVASVRATCPNLGDQLEALLLGDRAPLDYRLELGDVARKRREKHASDSEKGPSGVRVIAPVPSWRRPGSLESSSQSGRPQDDVLPGTGSVICQYEIIRELGRGGMGAVYLARDIKLGRRVAIKFLLSHDRRMTDRFLVEARTTAQCTHENIVIIHEVNERQGHPFMVLEYIQGRSLRQLLEQQEIGPYRAVEIAVAVLRGLACAHEMGIIHRDLKPENVMLTDAGTVKVLDFGIAKVMAAARQPGPSGGRSQVEHVTTDADGVATPQAFTGTGTSALIGTLPYMSPEQMNAEALDHRTDVWAVGVMLWEMVTGQHPLAPVSRDRLREVGDLHVPMPSMSICTPRTGALGSMIDRCLRKDRSQRIASAHELLSELETLLPARRSARLAPDENPFAGLAAFQEADADRFFGRSSDITSITARLRDDPLVTLIGPSGSGKSSLVRAGVLPALKRSGEGWDSLIVRPGRHPLAALAGTLVQFLIRLENPNHGEPDGSSGSEPGGYTTGHISNTTGQTADDSLDREAMAERLRMEPGFLGATLRTLANRKLQRIVLFVDQFEELYTLGADSAERAAFVACMEGVADDVASPLRLILSMRSDFLDRIAEEPAFMAEVTRGLVLLPPMARAGLREALTGPLEVTGHEFETDDLVETILNELKATRGVLPLLQFTAAKLWDSRDRERRLLTRVGYDAIGGVGGVLARHADAVLGVMSPSSRALVRTIFVHLVTPERTRAIAAVNELRDLPGDPDAIEQLVYDLANARLLAVHASIDGQGQTVEIIHESLIDDWPTLQRWLGDNQEDAVFLARVRTAARQWVRGGRSEGTLWRGQAERTARRWRQRYRGELSDLEREYIEATFALAERAARRRKLAMGGVMAFLVVALAAALVALVSIRDAQRETSQKAEELRAAVDRARREKRVARRAQAAAEQARLDAESATAKAVVAETLAAAEATSARASARSAERERVRALLAENKARRAESAAVTSEAKALSAEKQAQVEEANANQATTDAERSDRDKQILIDRAVGPIRRVLPM